MNKEFKDIEGKLKKLSHHQLSAEKDAEILKALDNFKKEKEFYSIKKGFFFRLTHGLKQLSYAIALLCIVAVGMWYLEPTDSGYELHLNKAQLALEELEGLALLIEEAQADDPLTINEETIRRLLYEISQETNKAIKATQEIKEPAELEAALKKIQSLEIEKVDKLNRVSSSLSENMVKEILIESSNHLEQVTSDLNAIEETTENEKGGIDENSQAYNTSSIQVSVAENNPPSRTISPLDKDTPLFRVNLNSTSDTYLTRFIIRHAGDASHDDWESFSLYKDGIEIAEPQALQSDTGEIMFVFNPALSLPKGISNIELRGNLSKEAAHDQNHYFLIDVADSIDSTIPVTGSFPMRSRSFSSNYQAICGNEFMELDEQCDDGNLENGDGCSAVCQLELNPLPANTEAGGRE